jgi:cytochrome c oxidase subunit IV
MAENLDPENARVAASLSPWAWGVIGGIAGTVARSNDWWSDKGGFQWRMFVADMSASGTIVIVAVLSVDWLNLANQYAAGFAAILALVGVRPLRDAATQLINIGVSVVAKRFGAK